MLHKSIFSARLLALAVSMSAGASQFGCTDDDPSVVNEDLIAESSSDLTVAAPKLVSGSAAVALLSPERRALLSDLGASSTVAPEATIEVNSKAVMALALSWTGGKPTRVDDALKFVALYQGLLDDKIIASEYVVGTSKLPCDNAAVTLDRVIDGIQVIGSRLTFHFDENGRLVFVSNGIASVPSTRQEVDAATLPGSSLLSKRMGQIKPENAKRQTVLVPMPDGSGLYKAELVSWFSNGRMQGVVAVGDIAVSDIIDAQSQNEGRTGIAGARTPKYAAGERSDVPSVMSYHSIGGLRISGMTGELNPLETAYRYLEEHPAVFHTGAARCQYTPRSITENPTIPGVYTARLAQRHGPVPVFGAELVIRLDGANTIGSVTGRTLGNVNISTTPTVTATQAVNAAMAMLNNRSLTTPAWQASVVEARAAIATTRLVILPRFLSRDLQVQVDRLAWQVDRGEFTVMIDAQNQLPLWSSSKRHAATIVRDGRNDSEIGYLGYATVAIDGITQPGAPTPPNSDVVASRLGGNVATTLMRLQGMYARNGVNEANLIASTNVRVSTAGGCPNAHYDSFLTNSAFFCLGIASADVVGHEMTHGVIAHSSGLLYADQSGAINEAYADLIGNLNDLNPGWLIGEQTVGGTMRDMQNPSTRGQPGHMSGYVPRSNACGLAPWDCDFGNVHTNSGILNRAHVLLTDGSVGRYRGIGRERMERLALVVMRQLPSSATLNQVAGVTRDVCDMFVARGVTTWSGLTFTSAHCDAVTNAFNEVGLNPSLSSGWLEPTIGFSGTKVWHPPGADGSLPMTPGRCPISNITLDHAISFPIVPPLVLKGDLAPSTAVPPRTAFLDWVQTSQFVGVTPVTSVSALPIPLGTPVRTHSVAWTSAYGVSPLLNTDVVSPATCTPPPQQLHYSAIAHAGYDDGTVTGNTEQIFGRLAPASYPAGCTFTDVQLQMLDGNGAPIAGPGMNLTHTITHWFLFVPVNFNASVNLATSAPSRPTSTNLMGRVTMNWDFGRTVRARWVYTFDLSAAAVASDTRCLPDLPPSP